MSNGLLLIPYSLTISILIKLPVTDGMLVVGERRAVAGPNIHIYIIYYSICILGPGAVVRQ